MKIFTRPIIACLFVFFTLRASAQNVIYVDASRTGGANNGTSWTDAYTNLQMAIDAADGTKAIWVAKGIYFPSRQLGSTTDRRDRAFILKEGVKVYGGFSGSEPEGFDLANRVFATNETTLSGDLAGEAGDEADELSLTDGVVSTISKNTTNTYHVVVSYNHTPATILDGFTISGGNADGSGTVTPLTGHSISRASGGGIYLRKSSPTFNNLIIKNNAAIASNSGAGIYISEGREIPASSPATASMITISNSTILNNFATGSGAGAHIVGSATSYESPLVLSNVNVRGNRAGSVGGGLRVNEKSIKANFQNVTFEKNIAGSNGGALYVNGNTALTITNSSFEENTGSNGGALYAAASSTVSIDGTTFTKNFIATSGGGGAVQANESSNLIITNTTFSENKAASGNGGALYLVATASLDANNVQFYHNIGNVGGAVNTSASNIANRINNAVFFNNQSNTVGGAIAFLGSAAVSVTGTTFFGNTATTNGGGLRLGGTGVDVKVYNSIFYGNTGTGSSGDISVAGGSLDLQYAITQEYGQDGINGVLVGADPQFLNVTDVSSANFLRLSPTASNPAIDAGNNDLIPSGLNLDLAGNTRVVRSGPKEDPTVDLGAYENALSTLPVKLSGFTAAKSGNNIRVSWSTASESNNSHFVLEKSTDGITFSNIAFLPSKGNGLGENRYQYTDMDAVNGYNYYRLTQVDQNGTTTTYKPVYVNFSLLTDAEVSVYPNPATDGKVRVNFAKGNFRTVQLVSLQGQQYPKLSISSNEKEKIIDLSLYPSGTYFLVFRGESVITKKLIKP